MFRGMTLADPSHFWHLMGGTPSLGGPGEEGSASLVQPSILLSCMLEVVWFGLSFPPWGELSNTAPSCL